MYIDNVYVSQIVADNSVYASQNQPVTNEEAQQETSLFHGILEDTINETNPLYATQAESTNVNAAIAMDSVPPVIKTQESAGSSYIDKYYPIPESKVIETIREVRHVINNEDMAAKTEVERYDFIENRFIDAFGKDFMIARDLFIPSSMFYMIGVEFNDTLGKHIENPEQVNRQRLHGNASAEVIQEKIRNEYPPNEALTNRNLFQMVGQMRSEGVLDTETVRNRMSEDGSRRIMDSLAFIKNYARYLTMPGNNRNMPMTMAERDRSWEKKLDDYINWYDLPRVYNTWKENGRMDIGADTAPFLVKNTGLELGDDGYFVVEHIPCDIEWTSLMDMMFAEMAEYDNLVRERMRAIDAEYYASMSAGAEAGIMSSAMGVTAGAEETVAAAESIDGEPEVEATTETAAAESETKAA